jgi:hypothetical protein
VVIDQARALTALAVKAARIGSVKSLAVRRLSAGLR